MKDLHSLRGPQAFKLAVKVLSNDPEKPQDLVPLYLQKKKTIRLQKVLSPFHLVMLQPPHHNSGICMVAMFGNPCQKIPAYCLMSDA